MVFNTGAALLDAIVLAVVSHEAQGTYGYKITQDVRQAIDISESTLYPVLRRLQKDGCLETYDMEFGGRNRRYYRITEAGTAQLNLYRNEWTIYSIRISNLFAGSAKQECINQHESGGLRQSARLQRSPHWPPAVQSPRRQPIRPSSRMRMWHIRRSRDLMIR